MFKLIEFDIFKGARKGQTQSTSYIKDYMRKRGLILILMVCHRGKGQGHIYTVGHPVCQLYQGLHEKEGNYTHIYSMS